MSRIKAGLSDVEGLMIEKSSTKEYGRDPLLYDMSLLFFSF
jgi:hypothetical protein